MKSHSRARAPLDDFTTHVLELLSPVGDITARSMFGAQCLFCAGRIIGILSDGALFLKVNEATRPAFEAEGGRPFTYLNKAKGTPVAMSYLTPPSSALDSREEMRPWALRAVDAAMANKPAKKPAKKPGKKPVKKPTKKPVKSR